MKTQDGDRAIVLETEAKSAYRAATARLSYLASDRPKLLFATKECVKASTCSSQADPTRLKRVGRFLLKEPQCVWSFPWQDENYVLEDFAEAGGFAKTRRSTSGGVLRLGGHTLGAWSSSHKVVAMSSCESLRRRSDWPPRDANGRCSLSTASGFGRTQALHAAWRCEPEAARSSTCRLSTTG